MKTRTQKIVFSALIAALICVATMIIKIPTPLKGYVNLGDCVVLLSGWILPPWYAFFAAAIGSALADVLSSYIIYAPATFVIKGLMALIAAFGFKLLNKKGKKAGRIFSGAAAEIVMVAGYFLFEGFMYGFLPSLANIVPNAIQGVFGLVFGIILINVFDKNEILK